MFVSQVETIGDAYMLASGLPDRNGDNHAVEIANAAMDLMSGITNFTVDHIPGYKLQIRIGRQLETLQLSCSFIKMVPSGSLTFSQHHYVCSKISKWILIHIVASAASVRPWAVV